MFTFNASSIRARPPLPISWLQKSQNQQIASVIMETISSQLKSREINVVFIFNTSAIAVAPLSLIQLSEQSQTHQQRIASNKH